MIQPIPGVALLTFNLAFLRYCHFDVYAIFLDTKKLKHTIGSFQSGVFEMLSFRLAGDIVCGKLLSTWLSLVVSMMVSFCTVFFLPRAVLDGILDLIESVSEGFPTNSYSFSFIAETINWFLNIYVVR